MSSNEPGTRLVVSNATSTSVTVWLTLGATAGTIQKVARIPWNITPVVNNQRQGSFTLAANSQTAEYTSQKVGFGGNLAFGTAPGVLPGGCPLPGWPNGINIFEFMLNNAYQPNNPQESIDISCVNGVNALIGVTMVGGGVVWTSNGGAVTVSSFANQPLGQNTNVIGVFPANCPGCTIAGPTPGSCGAGNPPVPVESPSSTSICTIQRDPSDNGGVVTVTFNGFTPSS